MTEILGIAEFTFNEGGFEQFERLSAQAMEVVRAKDTGTLQYDIYVNEDRSEAIVIERYTDSAALIEHGEHVATSARQSSRPARCTARSSVRRAQSYGQRLTPEGPVQLFTPLLSLAGSHRHG